MPKKRGNGEGTIYNNGKYWIGQVTVGINQETGKLKRKSIYGKTKKEVQEKITEMLNKVNKNIYIDESNITVGEWSTYWLENFKKNQLSGTSYTNYVYHINNHIIKPFGGIPLKNLTTMQIQTKLNEMKSEHKSGQFIWFVYNKLDLMFKQAIKMDLVYKNPCVGVSLPKVEMKKLVNPLTIEDQKKLVEYCNDKLSLYIFIFQLGTGMRIGESLGLVWNNVDFDNEIIRIVQTAVEIKGKAMFKDEPKTSSSRRIVPMSTKVKALLIQINQKQNKEKNNLNLVFPTTRYTIISQANMRRKFEIVCDEAGISRTNIHALRHTFTTRMLESGVNIKIISSLLGHKSIKITMDTYAHVLPDLKKENIVKIDEFL